MINHDVVWFHVTVHDALGMTKIQCLPESELTRWWEKRSKQSYLQELQHVESNIHVTKTRIEDLEVDVVDVFGNKTGNL